MRQGPIAVIDIGTNSTRLLIAQADGEGGRLESLHRDSRVTRLGRGVDVAGNLSDDGIDAACGAIADYIAKAEEAGVARTVAIATSAVRDSANGEAFVAELRERFDLAARILSGAEEARLTYAGALAGRVPRAGTAVIDVGGGSTELAIGDGATIGFRCSLQCGVVRQTERHLQGQDPPSPEGVESLADEVRTLLASEVPAGLDGGVSKGIAVAGTPTSLAAIELELDPYDPDRVHGHRLELDRIRKFCSELASVPLAERELVIGLQKGRAPTIVAGVIILIGVMRGLGLDQIEVSEQDILHGVALEELAKDPG